MTESGSTGRLDRLIASKEIVIACGPGGVGKTTTAAALGAAAALRSEASVLVLTVDPARRLADALGLSGIGNEATPVPAEAFRSSRRRPKGRLSVAMLDTSQSWDALIRRHAESPSVAEEIIANPLYRNITSRFARSTEYIAMERLFELHQSGRYDLLIVDTPPSQGALDFLDSPERMADFFSSRLLRWLTTPLRSRLVGIASRPFSQMADRVLGTQFLEDISHFFLLLQGMYGGFVDRARAVAALLHEQKTTFLVVTTPEEVPIEEARGFVTALQQRRLHLGAIVANKVLPASLTDAPAGVLADELRERCGPLGEELAGSLGADGAELARVLGEVGQSFSNLRSLAIRQSALLDGLASHHAVEILLPHLFGDVVDFDGLLAVGRRLFEG